MVLPVARKSSLNIFSGIRTRASPDTRREVLSRSEIQPFVLKLKPVRSADISPYFHSLRLLSLLLRFCEVSQSCRFAFSGSTITSAGDTVSVKVREADPLDIFRERSPDWGIR